MVDVIKLLFVLIAILSLFIVLFNVFRSRQKAKRVEKECWPLNVPPKDRDLHKLVIGGTGTGRGFHFHIDDPEQLEKETPQTRHP